MGSTDIIYSLVSNSESKQEMPQALKLETQTRCAPQPATQKAEKGQERPAERRYRFLFLFFPIAIFAL